MARKGPGTDGPLQTALLESTSAATTRASEGQKIFSPIAAFLDKHRSQTTGLAPHLLRALTTLSDDLASVAQRHFSAYISARKMEAYAIYSSLRSQLNSNSSALKEVQATKTGFTLCPSSPEALLTLKAQKEIISTFSVNYQIERSS
ncbi:hypothetical protein TSTA_000800 [Talaromyces stipitatus ATCC 10500]|uniref:Uncharacterized protein n=1 Tax=Talaromyces stipitatus (strain ATCC 10500 / CBS 375.48 / QM 6759 / NRRL 1006) TaxID=441959 RepID=B8MSI0_TALSN|nr:uncharacterized protein TSTA_000800 [Talaromyces stipitatus ATCC 10500]EED12008.1 hypothetical protein TSTA_000800 [Talaromyces stipitatus ATCC 10500]